jgi:hypothetical protein
MTPLGTMRRFGPWLLGLFLIAQITGVGPLISAQTLHVFETNQTVSDAHGASTGAHRGGHHHGIADAGDQCCAFHHLAAGFLPYVPNAAPVGFARTSVFALPASSLVTAEPNLLDRPPKALSLI